MLVRLVLASFGRQRRRKVVALAAVALGTAAASGLLDVALGVGDQVNRELKSFGANLVVYPAGSGRSVILAGADVTRLRAPSYLAEADVLKAKENFWINNVLALAPVLDVSAEVDGRDVLLRGTWFERSLALSDGRPFVAGMRAIFPFWSVQGAWPGAPGQAVVGAALAKSLGISPGKRLEVGLGERRQVLEVTGVLESGGEEDGVLLTDLATVQQLSDLSGKVGHILVSALTTPEEEAVTRLGLDPRSLTTEEFERWSCTPFVSSIAYEIGGQIPGAEVRPIRRVADTEGRILGRISGLMTLLAAMAVAAAALTVTSSLTTGVLERRGEIGLLKAMGATNRRVVALFLLEATAVGALGGLLGAAGGFWIARSISVAVFGSPVPVGPFAVPLAVIAAMTITLAGSALPARRISSFRPFEVLHGL